jgi:hypothetical protein
MRSSCLSNGAVRTRQIATPAKKPPFLASIAESDDTREPIAVLGRGQGSMSISLNDFQPISFQAVIFTEKANNRVDKILKWLPSPWSKRLPEPNVLGFDLPLEVPLILWQKDKKPWSASVAQTSFSVTWRNFLSAGDEKIGIDEFLKMTAPFLLSYKKHFKLRVHRIGFVCQRFTRQNNPAKMLAEHFCKSEWIRGPLNRPEYFEIHAHKRFDLRESEKINSWMRIKVVKLLEETQSNEPVIVAEQDFNTLEDAPERSCKDSDISKFFDACPDEIDKVLDLYFPVA